MQSFFYLKWCQVIGFFEYQIKGMGKETMISAQTQVETSGTHGQALIDPITVSVTGRREVQEGHKLIYSTMVTSHAEDQ